MRESAFVETTDDGVYFVSNTVVGTPSEALVPLVEAARKQDPGSVVVREGEDVPADLGHEAVLTVHVTERDGRSVILLALADRPGAVGEEDRQLLELLVSHASMALETAPTPTAGARLAPDGEETAGT